MTDVLRLVAGLAAVGLIAAPAIMAGYRKASAWLGSRKGEPAQATGIGLAEMRTVLDLATKLKAAGLADGVTLCQQLLDVMLCNGPKAKK